MANLFRASTRAAAAAFFAALREETINSNRYLPDTLSDADLCALLASGAEILQPDGEAEEQAALAMGITLSLLSEEI